MGFGCPNPAGAIQALCRHAPATLAIIIAIGAHASFAVETKPLVNGAFADAAVAAPVTQWPNSVGAPGAPPQSTSASAAPAAGKVTVPAAEAEALQPAAAPSDLQQLLEENKKLKQQAATELDVEEQLREVVARLKSRLRSANMSDSEEFLSTTILTTTAVPTVMVGKMHVNELLFQKGILASVCFCMVFLWVLPLVKPFRKICETRFYKCYPVLTFFNFLLFGVVLNHLSRINVNECFFLFVKLLEIVIDDSEQVLIGLAGIAVLVVFWKFKDRILEALGVENAGLVFGEFRDWATCWSMYRFQPLELYIWKVEGIPAVKLHVANTIFCEVSLGYNVKMKTRVHHRAGHSCVLKESVQLNFDPVDADQRLHITIKNQDVMSSADISSVQLGAQQVDRLKEPSGGENRNRRLGWGAASSVDPDSVWAPSRFIAVDLIPAGKIYIRFAPTEGEDADRSCWPCCCLFGSSSRAGHTQSLTLEEGHRQ